MGAHVHMHTGPHTVLHGFRSSLIVSLIFPHC